MIDATAFGVIADGSTDNTRSLNEAVVAARKARDELCLPPGRILTNGVRIHYARGMKVVGTDVGLTTLKKISAINDSPVIDIFESSDITLSDFSIDGNRGKNVGVKFDSATNGGIKAVNLSNAHFRNLFLNHIPGWSIAIRPNVKGHENIVLENIETNDTARFDIGAQGTAKVWIDGLKIRNLHDTSAEAMVIDQGGTNGFVMRNSVINGTRTMPAIGITLRGGGDAWFLNNKIHLERDGNLVGLEIGEDQHDTWIHGNDIYLNPSDAANNKALNFAVGNGSENVYILRNRLQSRGGTSGNSFIVGSDTPNLRDIYVIDNFIKSLRPDFRDNFIRFSNSKTERVFINNNTLDGSRLTKEINFIELSGREGRCNGNLFIGGDERANGIVFEASSFGWKAMHNIFDGVSTKWVINPGARTIEVGQFYGEVERDQIST